METKHTPGPWYQHRTKDKVYANVRSANVGCIADCGSRSDSIAQANAAFIVRACNSHDKLLEACKTALWELQGNLEHGTAKPIIEAAIAEAEKGA